MDHVATEAVGPPQQVTDAGKIRLRQRLAHQRTRDPMALLGDRGHGVNFHAKGCAEPLQQREVAGAPGAEAKVIADQEPLGMKSLDEDAGDEILGACGCQRLVEVGDADPIDSDFGQRLQLVAQIGDPDRFGPAGRKELPRMRLERQHATDQAMASGIRNQPLQQRLVTTMDAVEIADGQRARLALVWRREAAEYFHNGIIRRRVPEAPRALAGKAAANIAPMQNPPPRSQLVVLISGRGSNLRSLVRAIAAGDLDAQIAGVISNRPDAAGLSWAASQGLATRALDHRAYPDRAAFDLALAEAVDELAAGPQTSPWVVLAGFMRILGEAFIRHHGSRIVNIHPSLLPLYPGLRSHRQALADGALLHGATVHLVTAKLDHGPIVAQALVPVLAEDTEDMLAERVLEMEHRLYPLALQWLVSGRAVARGSRVQLDGMDLIDQRLLLHPLLAGAQPATPPRQPARGAGE
jgi:phosphoribosylglycinamide formyltransferase-1